MDTACMMMSCTLLATRLLVPPVYSHEPDEKSHWPMVLNSLMIDMNSTT